MHLVKSVDLRTFKFYKNPNFP